jgi:hypothetical protein
MSNAALTWTWSGGTPSTANALVIGLVFISSSLPTDHFELARFELLECGA